MIICMALFFILLFIEMKEFKYEDLFIGIIVASVLIIFMILPIYCCKVSNEDYQ
jgi:multisubunit Na+/H+ antiporter MnhE subunit